MRTAIIDVDCDWVAETLGTLADAGVRIIRTLDSSPLEYMPVCRFVIASPDLPEECENARLLGLRRVRALLSQHCYGRQKMTKVDRFLLVDEPRRS